MAFPLYISNDHALRLVGLRKESDWTFLTSGVTVEATLYNGLTSSKAEVTGQTWPVTMNYISPGTSDIGGEAGGRTVVKSVSGLDITATVGTTNPLVLEAGAIIEALHDEKNKWRVVEAVASTAAGQDAVIHVEPFIWSSSSEPKTVSITAGEILLVTDGIYEARIEDTVVVSNNTKYYAEIKATHATFGQGVWQVEVKAQNRIVK